MSQSLPSLSHLAAEVVTLPVKVAARAVGLVRGSVSVARQRVTGPAPAWDTVDVVPARDQEPAPVGLGTDPAPVNVTEELGLDPAPVDPPRPAPRTAPVTSIDQQAEPGLVDSTPADVAARLGRD